MLYVVSGQCDHFSNQLVAVLVGNHAVDLAVVHIALHGVGVGSSLVAGNLEFLHSGVLVVPLMEREWRSLLNIHFDLQNINRIYLPNADYKEKFE